MSAVVVGAGHNGLVSGLLLARAGLEVTVLEAEELAGGCVWTHELPGGHRVERGAVDHGGVLGIALELGLSDVGLRYVERERMTTVVFGDGERRDFEVSAERTAQGLGADGEAYRGFVERARSLFGMLDQFAVPPTPTELGAALSRLRGGDETFRLLLSSAEAVLDRTFTDSHLRGALALYAAHGQVPPWAPGSGMFSLLLPSSHDAPAVRPVGGSSALTSALVTALEAAGGTVRTGAHVTSMARDGEGWTVHLADGEMLRAHQVVSTLDVRRTVDRLVDPPEPLRRAARAVGSGRLNVAELTVCLAGGPGLAAAEVGGPHGPVCFVQDGLEDLGRTFGDVVAGRLPSSPWAMLAATDPGPSADDDARSLWMSSVVPRRRAEGVWDVATEAAAADRVVATVSRVLGLDLLSHTDHMVVTGPATWAARLHGDGNPNHLDLTIDQLMGWRPPGVAGHRTPVPGLYLAGAGTHPGGGLSGVPAPAR